MTVKENRAIAKLNFKLKVQMGELTSTQTHLHFLLFVGCRWVPCDPVWYQMTYCLLLVQILCLVPGFWVMVVTGMKAGRTWVWGTAPFTSQYHFQRFPQKNNYRLVSFSTFKLSTGLSSLGYTSACYQASRFVQDSVFRPLSLKGTIALTGFLANVMKSLLPHPFSQNSRLFSFLPSSVS